MKYVLVYALVLLVTLYTSAKALNKTELPKDTIKAEAKELSTSYGIAYPIVYTTVRPNEMVS